MPKSSEYWKKRFEELEAAQHNKGVKYLIDLEDQFRRATSTIETQIATWYQRLADNNEISYTKARQMLNSKELKEFKWTVEEYIKAGETNSITAEWMKELENASARVHISRLEAQKVQMQHQLEVLYGNQSDDIDRLMTTIYTDGYYHTAYEIQKGFSLGHEFAKLDTKRIDKVLSKPWTPDGKNFSERIWGNKTKLVNNLYTNLTQSIIRGDSPDKAIRNISQIMNTSRNNAGRLVMTEAAFFASASQKDCFNELDIERYEIVATLDSHTSDICQGLDGQVFKMSDYQVGLTAPPFHVYCRTTTVPYFDDEFTIGEERAYRDKNGKTQYVKDMSYNDWYKEFIENDSDYSIKVKKEKNLLSDTEQHENYKTILGKEHLPKTVDEFQDIKYTDINEYGVLKAQIKGMTYYNKAILNESEITKKIKEVAASNNMKNLGLKYKIKEKDSYLEKIRKNYKPDGNEYEIKDIVRYTLGADTKSLVKRTLQSIDMFNQEGYNTIRIKNTWKPKSQYKGINTSIKAPNGQMFEVQYHTQESFDLKNNELHKIYEKLRKLNDYESDEYIELEDKMIELSDKLITPKGITEVKNK
ncbi:MAG: minor capsid protein [Lachnotalea sp.]